MVVRTLIFIFFSLILFSSSIIATYAKVEAISDRTVLSINESLTLQIVQTGDSDGEPNFTPLEENFSIVSKSQSQQYSIINGNSSKKHIWSLNLLPKKAGEVVIPSLSIGSESTLPIQLVIQKSAQNISKNGIIMSNQDVFIEVKTYPEKEAYVQQKVDLKIHIYSRIQLSNLALSPLSINDVIMEQVGEDKQYNKMINQQTYMVIERHYAIFPQKSGILTIPAIRFEAMKNISNNQFGSSFGFFNQRGKPIYKQSQPMTIHIKHQDKSFTGKHWLPAENVQVISQHSNLSDIKVGDSITITDKIIAKGVLGSLIPAIQWPKIKGAKSYPDQSKNNSQIEQGNLYGLREEKIAIIPMHSGQYQLPDRKIIWWDTVKNKQQQKIIPGISFQVNEAENSISLADQKAIQHNNILPALKPHRIDNNKQLEDKKKPFTKASEPLIKNYNGYLSSRDNPWFWAWLVSSLVLSVLLIISLFYAFKTPSSTKIKTIDKDKKHLKQQDLIKKIKSVSQDNDKAKTLSLLIQWANSYFQSSQLHNINTLCKQINNPQLEKEIALLDKALYSAQADQWQGQQLFKAFKNYLEENKATNKKRQNKSLLEPLNPI